MSVSFASTSLCENLSKVSMSKLLTSNFLAILSHKSFGILLLIRKTKRVPYLSAVTLIKDKKFCILVSV